MLTADKESLKQSPADVFFISLVGADTEGFVDVHEHIFDIYTKLYDFHGSNVKIKSAQDLWEFYKSKHKGADRKKIDVYKMAEFFVEQHFDSHFVVDECPFREKEDSSK